MIPEDMGAPSRSTGLVVDACCGPCHREHHPDLAAGFGKCIRSDACADGSLGEEWVFTCDPSCYFDAPVVDARFEALKRGDPALVPELGGDFGCRVSAHGT